MRRAGAAAAAGARAAAAMAAATSAVTPGTSSVALTAAAWRLIAARVWATRTSRGRWAIGKLPTARSVCVPQRCWDASMDVHPTEPHPRPAHGPTVRPVRPVDSYAAVLFDLDGVLTPTADIHQRA